MNSSATSPSATHKARVAAHFDRIADRRSDWYRRNHLYHSQIVDTCRLFLNPDSRVLELGCSVGDLLGELNPGFAVGIDISPVSIEKAGQKYPQYHWICADVEDLPANPALVDPFDIVIVEDLVGYLHDIQGFLQTLKRLMHPGTRLIITAWNWVWEPVLHIGERLGVKAPDLDARQNWISPTALELFLELSDYALLRMQPGLLFPYKIPLLTRLINALSYAPLVSRFVLLNILVTRPILAPQVVEPRRVSVIIPTRNEAGNIPTLVERTPDMGLHTELIFVDGNSTDGTVEAIHEAIAKHPERDIKFIPQVSAAHPDSSTSPNLMLKLGKGDAVRKGFTAAAGDILMILDSDVSVPPEELRRFYDVLVTGKARFANGTRFVYTQETGAMKPVNRFGNIFFSRTFSILLGQQITDTLCGTKVVFKGDYEAIAANRAYFGDFDPFGDFDLLFGAAWLKHPIKDVPVHYLARTYGESKVRVSLHGPLLARMCLLALWHFKLRPLFSRRRAVQTQEADGS